MATPAQIRANRANARKSTGPRSPQGKARSSRNAVKHGFRSPSFHPADTAAPFLRDLQPATLGETVCVLEIAHASGRLRTLDQLDIELNQQQHDPATLLRKIQTLARYRGNPERTFYRAIQELKVRQQKSARTNPILIAADS